MGITTATITPEPDKHHAPKSCVVRLVFRAHRAILGVKRRSYANTNYPPIRNLISTKVPLSRTIWCALAVTAVLLTACPPPGGNPPPEVTLTFAQATVRKSKLLVSTNGNVDQTFTNTLRANGTAVTAGAAYSITEKPAGLTNQITVNPATGEVTFGKPALDKVTTDGPQTVTIQAAYKGKTASYAFTVTDHFSPRDLHTSVVLGGDIYVIGGITRKYVSATGTTPAEPQISSNEVWRSSDEGLTWDQTAGGTRFTERGGHESVVLDGALYVIAGGAGTFGDTALDDVWRSADRGVSWSRVTSAGASVPFPMDYRFASAVLGSTMYVLGGIQSTPFTRLDEVWQSTDRGVTWTQATNTTDPKFSARSQSAAVVLGNAGPARLYVIGGSGSSSNNLDDVWESGDGASWTQVNASAAASDKFPARNSHSAVAVGDTVYVIAGEWRSAVRGDVWTSGDKGATWTRAAANAEFPARQNHASTTRGGTLYVIGGSASSTRLFNDVWKSTDGGRSWVNVHKNP